MTDAPAPHQHVLPSLRVVRGPDGVADLFIDGQRYPHPIDASVEVLVQANRAPAVRVTLLAAVVQVDDTYLSDLPPRDG